MVDGRKRMSIIVDPPDGLIPSADARGGSARRGAHRTNDLRPAVA